MDKLPTYEEAGYDQLQQVPQEYASAPPLQLPHTQSPTIVTIGGSISSGITNYGPKSQNATCPHCRHVIYTKIKSKATTKTHLWACCLLPCCCCCLPHCLTSCVNTNHYCPNCDHFLGTYQS